MFCNGVNTSRETFYSFPFGWVIMKRLWGVSYIYIIIGFWVVLFGVVFMVFVCEVYCGC